MMVRPKILPGVEKVCFYCRLKVPDKTSLALHYVRQHWEEVRRRQGQTYKPRPDADVNKGRIYASKPTTGNGGSLRRVKVSPGRGEELRMANAASERKVKEAAKKVLVPEQQRVKLVHEGFNDDGNKDDAQRMVRRQAMMAAKRLSVPAQKIKLVYHGNSNKKSGKGNDNEAQEKTTPVEARAMYEELERRMKLKGKVATGPTGPGMENNAIKQVSLESSRPALVGGLKLRDISELTNASEKVSKVGEENQGEEPIVVEDELLPRACEQQRDFVVEHDNVKKASRDAQEARTKMDEGEKDHRSGVHGGPEGSLAGKEIVAPLNDEARKRVGQESTAEQVPTSTEHSALHSPTIAPSKRKENLTLPTITPTTKGAHPRETPTADPSSSPGSPITLSKRKKAPKSSPTSNSSGTIFGFETPSPSLEMRSRAMSSLIRSNENQVAPGEAEASSVDVTAGCDGDGVRRFDHAGQDDQERCKRFEVRLFKLDELRLHEAMGTSGLGVVDEEDFNEEDFELPTTHEVHAGEILDQTEVLDLAKSDGEDSSKFFMKKNCVVKIAKMAWLDEVSRKERGQDT